MEQEISFDRQNCTNINMKTKQKEYSHKTFLSYTWKQILKMARLGKVGPHVYKEEELMLAGLKPVWSVVKYDGEDFISKYGSDYVMERIPAYKNVTDLYVNWAIYHKDNRKAFERFCAACEIFKGEIKDFKCDEYGNLIPDAHNEYLRSDEGLTTHIELGLALGFTKYDIAAYIAHNYNEDRFNNWKKSV